MVDLTVVLVLALLALAFVVGMVAGVLVARRLYHRTMMNQERYIAQLERDVKRLSRVNGR